MALQTEFLKQFTKELLINSLSGEDLEKLKRRKLEQKIIIKPSIKEESLLPSLLNKENMQIQPVFTVEQKPIINEEKTEQDYYGNLYLGKIIPFVLDPGVISIECPGAGKFISIKKMGKIMITRTTLDKEHIQEIIDSFSRESKIPIIGGVFKAIVNNLVITAIESVYGYRFIISKTMAKPSQFL